MTTTLLLWLVAVWIVVAVFVLVADERAARRARKEEQR